MPSVKLAPAALQDLQRLREFLRTKSPVAAQRAGATIAQAVRSLGDQPEIGRPAPDMAPDYRELVIDFGGSGYVALYRYVGQEVVVLAIRHQREAGY